MKEIGVMVIFLKKLDWYACDYDSDIYFDDFEFQEETFNDKEKRKRLILKQEFYCFLPRFLLKDFIIFSESILFAFFGVKL